MQIDILVEEPSAETALRHLLPKMSPGQVKINIINMHSKDNLLKKLPARLQAYQDRIDKGERLRIVVLVDRDNEDCIRLKAKLETMAHAAKLSTKTSPDAEGGFVVLNRIVVEELEAWFLGDPDALRKAFPSLRKLNFNAKPFQNPDNGGTWETLHRILRKNGIYRSCYPKIDAARRISQHMEISANRSKSFQAFVSGIKTVLDS